MVAENAVLFFQGLAHIGGNVAGAHGEFQADFFKALRKRLGLNVQSHVEDGVRLYRICKVAEVAGK